MNTDPNSKYFLDLKTVKEVEDLARKKLTKKEQWVELTEEELSALRVTLRENRLAKLLELRPDMPHNQRKQTLKRRGLR